MLRLILIAFLAMIIMSDALFAQSQSSGRGRFLQRIRDDVFGVDKSQPSQPQNSQNSQSGRQPTPISNSPNTRSQFGPASNAAPGPSAVPNRNGFGFNVTVSDKGQLFVSQVDRQGNAAEAGVRQGDRIEEIGGIESNTVLEFEEIAKIMQQGDQMEFKISRNGQDSKVMVQYGNARQPEPEAASSSIELPNANSNREDNRSYDFAPPLSASSRSKSVLDSPAPRNNRKAQPVSQNFSDQADARNVQQLEQTIANQNREIQNLQREIGQLRRSMRSK